MNTHTMVADMHQNELAMNTHTMVADMHQNVFKTPGDNYDQNQAAVSDT